MIAGPTVLPIHRSATNMDLSIFSSNEDTLRVQHTAAAVMCENAWLRHSTVDKLAQIAKRYCSLRFPDFIAAVYCAKREREKRFVAWQSLRMEMKEMISMKTKVTCDSSFRI